VNARIGRLYGLLSGAFLLLILTVTYWQIWAAPGLAERQANPRRVFRELTIDRGAIRTADGVVLARNRPEKTSNGRTFYRRVYPQLGWPRTCRATTRSPRAGAASSWPRTTT
jgi:hypothetical protein